MMLTSEELLNNKESPKSFEKIHNNHNCTSLCFKILLISVSSNIVSFVKND